MLCINTHRLQATQHILSFNSISANTAFRNETNETKERDTLAFCFSLVQMAFSVNTVSKFGFTILNSPINAPYLPCNHFILISIWLWSRIVGFPLTVKPPFKQVVGIPLFRITVLFWQGVEWDLDLHQNDEPSGKQRKTSRLAPNFPGLPSLRDKGREKPLVAVLWKKGLRRI